MKRSIQFFATATLTGSLFATAALSQPLQPWMSPEVGEAWKQGYKGESTSIHVIDDFKSSYEFYGKLNSDVQQLRHGNWTLQQASMIAPSAKMVARDLMSGSKVVLNEGLNVINLSHSAFAPAGSPVARIDWGKQNGSVVQHATRGTAVVAKSAGNDAVAVGSANSAGEVDYLGLALKGAPSAVYVGALNKNGTVVKPAALAGYSNFAGRDPAVQKQFLVVGVEGGKTGLHGTSFAVPIVSGYAAILGSKFTKATPTQITNQLLDTARKDTIVDYSVAVHGRGEASIARALSPRAIR